MTIERIKINSFGLHKNLELHFTGGINVLYGENESGKSTLLAFVRSVLYGFDSRVSDNPRKKYMPWDATDGRFGGELIFTHMDKRYRATALFTQSKRTDIITLYNDITGAVIVIPDGQSIGEYILGLTASAFDCSVFAAQLNSRGDFARDRSGLLISRLSAASNKTPESSSSEADRRLKEAISRISSPRKGDGILDKLLQKQAALKEALSRLEDQEERVGELASQLEALTLQETKLDSRRKYYLQFREIKQAFGTLENRKIIKSRQKELSRLSAEIEDMKEPIDQELYDIPEKSSKLLLFFAFLLVIVFGAGIFFSTFAILRTMSLAIIIGGFTGTLLALCGSLICFLKSKKLLIPQSVPEEDAFRLKQLETLFYKSQEELDQLLAGTTLEEYEARWQEAGQLIENAGLDKTTFSSIRQCPQEVLNEKLEKATSELMEVQSQISYKKACMDTLQASGSHGQAGMEELITSDDIYKTLGELEKEITDCREKLEALTLARRVLAQSSEELQTTFGPIINMRTQSYLQEITGCSHGEIRISGDFDVSLYDGTNLVCHSSGDYSGATEDQIYLALRCALISLISPEEAPLPLYLDDPFVQYDDSRLHTAAVFLEQFTEKTGTQIFLATCQSRAISLFTQNNNILYLKGEPH